MSWIYGLCLSLNLGSFSQYFFKNFSAPKSFFFTPGYLMKQNVIPSGVVKGSQSSIHHCFNFFSLLLNLGKLLMICLQVHRLFIICILLLCFSTEFLFVILSVPNFPSYRTFCKLHFLPNLQWFGAITYYFFYSCISECTKYRICLHLSSFYSCIQFKRQGYSVLTPSHWNLL